MATTPSAGGDIHTPSAPLHGALYDSYEPYSPRYRTRSSNREFFEQSRATPEPVHRVDSRSLRAGKSTPPPKSTLSHHLNPNLSPPQTTRRSPRKNLKNRVFPASPSSPNTATMEDLAPLVPGPSDHPAGTTFRGGMLPTPVKTPRKKPVANVEVAARALFQDQPQDLQDIAAVPRRSKKNRRHNGFSLESFSAGDGSATNEIQIFTDSRDRVPEADTGSENPFTRRQRGKGTSVKKESGTSKRRKITGGDKKDQDVEDAFKKDEGMVYVFRGNKVYRKFESDEEEDEEIEPNELGLLAHSDGVIDPNKPLHTLTRKSIKPTRLFQSEIETRDLEAEKEEEALTEIEDNSDESSEMVGPVTANKTAHITKFIDSATPTAQHAVKPITTKTHLEWDSDHSQGASHGKTKKPSPFDTWKRVKKGTVAEASAASKGKKRISEIDEDESKKKMKA